MSKVYPPSEAVTIQANVKEYNQLYHKSITQREQFWAEQSETLEWYKKWDKVLDTSKKPFFKWFVGAQTNIIHNAIDRHLKTWRRNTRPSIWARENGDLRRYSFHALNSEVTNFAIILKALGA